MSKDNGRQILVAGTEKDKVFWQTMYLLDELMPVRITATDSKSTFQALNNNPVPFLVLVLSACLSEKLTKEDLMSIREDYWVEIIVAGQFTTRRGEQQARAIGISCYLLLPDQAPLLAEQTQHLLNVCRRRLENMPGHMRRTYRYDCKKSFLQSQTSEIRGQRSKRSVKSKS